MTPTITVAIPAYNVAQWIGEALNSVLGQTEPPDEVVVVDDGSTDDTLEALAGYRHAVRLVQQENGGSGEAMNRAFAEARGEYVAVCPADDLWVAHKLEWQRATLDRHPEVDVSFGAAELFGLSSGPFAQPLPSGIQDRTQLLRTLYRRNVIPNPTSVIRRSLHRHLGGYRGRHAEDYRFWLLALGVDAVFHYDERVLASLRQHGANLSGQALETWEANLAIHREFADNLGDDALAAAVLAKDLATVGRCRLGLGRAEGALAAYRESVRHRWTIAGAVGVAALRLAPARRALTRLANGRRRRTRPA